MHNRQASFFFHFFCYALRCILIPFQMPSGKRPIALVGINIALYEQNFSIANNHCINTNSAVIVPSTLRTGLIWGKGSRLCHKFIKIFPLLLGEGQGEVCKINRKLLVCTPSSPFPKEEGNHSFQPLLGCFLNSSVSSGRW